MGTRGMYGFYKDGITKATYNHYDSDISGLGFKVANFIKSKSIKDLNRIFDRIIIVDANTHPTEEQIKQCEQYINTSIGEPSKQITWYQLLRETQGDLSAYEDDIPYMIDYSGFITDSLNCEWAYLINLDTNKLEIYEGFQRKQNEPKHRYSIDTPQYETYYSCDLIKEIPLLEVSKEALEELNNEEY